jgi:ABC-type proline/glycine betaine transport system permease subunit
LSLVNRGIGFWPAAIAIFLYSQLPIIRNTYTAINNIDPALRDATISALTAEVDVDKKSVTEVAQGFLKAQGLL